AWGVLTRAEQTAQAARLSSPTLAWALAVAADCRGDPSNAVAYVMAALERDPCSPSIIGSFRIITGHVRADLQRMDPRRPNVPSAFRLLAQMGEADASAFFKYSLHSEASGNEVAALTLAQDAVEMAPPTFERLSHLARLLEAAGRDQEARARLDEANTLLLSSGCPKAQA